MTSPDRLSELQRLRVEFYADGTTRERLIEILTQVRDWAGEEMPESKCVKCGQPGISIPWDEALIEGHCYSAEGEREYRAQSGLCEFCFDRLFAEPDEPDEPPESYGGDPAHPRSERCGP